MSGRVQSVAVVGRDAGLWLAVIALRRALARAGIRVQAVELPSLHNPVDVYAAIPSISGMHRLLGLDEQLLLKACSGVPMVAQRFSNWGKAAPPFLLAYDDEPPPGGDLPFTQYWVKGSHEGLRAGIEEFSVGSVAARVGRVPRQEIEEITARSASYGYHLDAMRYSALLKALAIRGGAEVVSGALTDVAIDGDRIGSVALSGGERVEADLLIDASGSEGALIRQMPDARFESWREWLPCDRMVVASGPRFPNLPAFSQVSAFSGGWIGLHPLQDRTAVVAVYGSAAISDDRMAQEIGVLARIPVAGDAIVSRLDQGAQERPWIGNCVAIGEAAIGLEPLDAVQLHLAHGCISHLISYFPVSADEMPEADAYNSSIGRFAENVRDHQIAHYKLNRRFDEPLWDACRDAQVPATLARKLELFAARALVTEYDDESFHEQSWAAMFLGHGLVPEGYDPRVDMFPDDVHIEKVQSRLKAVGEEVKRMPTVDQFLGQAVAPATAQVS